MLKGFRAFLLRGNIVDLAIAVVIGAAFTAIVKAFTDNVINPLIAALPGGGEQGWGFQILADKDATFINGGAVLTAVINFVMVAAVVYFAIVVPYEKIRALTVRVSDEEVPKTEADLLAEIRDLLRGGDAAAAVNAAIEHPKVDDKLTK